MSSIRLSKVLNELNIGLDTALDFLADKGHDIERNRNAKIDEEQYAQLLAQFEKDKTRKEKSEQVIVQKKEEKEMLRAEREETEVEAAPQEEVIRAKAAGVSGPKLVGKIDLEKKQAKEEPQPKEEVTPEPAPEVKPEAPAAKEPEKEEPVKETPKAEEKPAPPKEEKEPEEVKPEPAAEEKAPEKAEKAEKEKAEKEETKAEEAPKPAPEAEKEPPAAKEEPAKPVEDPDRIKTNYTKLEGPRLTGQTIDLSKFQKPVKKKVASSTEGSTDNKRKRKRINKTGAPGAPGAGRPGDRRQGAKPGGAKAPAKAELSDEDIQKQIRETLEKLTGSKKSKGAKLRRSKREERREMEAMAEIEREEQSRTLQVTEFVTVTELATMMSVPTTQVISACMSLGIMVTMNQRLDAETLTIVAEEFGYGVEFVDADVQEAFAEEDEQDENLESRAPIVTVMGHVDHGKTSLLDYVRSANVIAGESGGITQHIGAYNVELNNGQHITFLDTPGHEAFTAMRARGAQVTDVVIIVVAADDAVMPQTKEAISHAQAAGVPFVVAINKVDKANANSEKIREQLAGMNILVEDWGGKVQCQEISAKTGKGVKELLDKVLLEAEILDLKANPNRLASGTVIEASLDKGRGYVTTILVQNGSLRVGDYLLAGPFSGKVRAMVDERGHRVEKVGPAGPVSILGLDGAPQAGDKFTVMEDEREAKQIAARRQQLMREQSVRTTKNITLEEIGRRLALGDFKELNIILKGDVDGSIEALTDSLQKLSTEQIQVRIIHRAVGQISESDVLLAAASDAIIVGFQVRPSANARKLAEKEEVDIRLYSIIYDAINEIKAAMEGMLSPELKEEITCNVEVRETFKISKVGTVAGCMVMDGTITRNTRVRIIRNGVVIYTGELGSLKRFKDDVKEVSKGYECGLNIHNFNDIKVGDIIEGFKEVEVKKTL